MTPRFGIRVLLGAVLLWLSGCRSSPGIGEVFLSAPPVVPGGDALMRGIGRGPQGLQSDAQAASASAAADGPVILRAALSHRFYNRSSPERLILKVDLVGVSASASVRRPLNLALVIDRSGSMKADQKFVRAIEAARLVFENLSDSDIVSLVAFNQEAIVLSPAGKAVNKAFLGHRIQDIGPDGYTNLSAGILEGFAQIESQKAEGQQRQVLVLTDGLANRGITDRQKLRDLVQATRDRGIGLSTFGCGTEFDEKLLTALAEAGAGRYTYVRSADEIPSAIAAGLGGLLEVVAQNVKLDIRMAGDGVISRVYGRLLDKPQAAYAIPVGDFRQGERSVLLFEITPPKSEPQAPSTSVNVTLTYDNPQVGRRQEQTLSCQASLAEHASQIEPSQDRSVVLYAAVRDALERAEEALLGLDIERYRQVAKQFDELHEKARRRAVETRDQELLNQAFLLKHFMAELSAAAETDLLHGHEEARKRLSKEVDYRRYLLEHHRGHP